MSEINCAYGLAALNNKQKYLQQLGSNAGIIIYLIPLTRKLGF